VYLEKNLIRFTRVNDITKLRSSRGSSHLGNQLNRFPNLTSLKIRAAAPSSTMVISIGSRWA
jgi:hypothetical protein